MTEKKEKEKLNTNLPRKRREEDLYVKDHVLGQSLHACIR